MTFALAATLSAIALTPTPGAAGGLDLPAPQIVPPALASPALPTGSGAAELSVLTYNIHGLPWPFAKGRSSALKEIGLELAELRRQGRQPDIVLIQEGFRGEVADLVKASGYSYWAQGPDRSERAGSADRPDAKGFRTGRYRLRGERWGKFLGGGLHVLSDAPIVDVEDAPYRFCAGFDCLANKGVMMVRVALPNVPGDIEVVNTHMNSKGASKTPRARSLAAHNLQAEEMLGFIDRHHDVASPLLVGGDFNVRNAPDRFAPIGGARTYAVVSQFCDAAGSACDGQAPGAQAKPWLRSQDLQGFAGAAHVDIRPISIGKLFGVQNGVRLSDHDGYLVRYRLTWDPAAVARPVAATPRPDWRKLNVKVSLGN